MVFRFFWATTLRRLGIIAFASAVSFAAGWSAHRMRLQAPIFCDDVTCAHLAERLTAVADQIAEAGERPRYLAIGDSLTEGIALPELCGRRGINAGIAGATTVTFLGRARGLAKTARPDFVVLGLGTNDAIRGEAAGFRDRLAAIVSSLSDYPTLLLPLSSGPNVPDGASLNDAVADLLPVRSRPVPAGNTVPDGVHYNRAGNAIFLRNLAEAAARLVPSCSPSTTEEKRSP